MLIRVHDVWVNPDHVACVEPNAIVGVTTIRMSVGRDFAIDGATADIASLLNRKQAVAKDGRSSKRPKRPVVRSAGKQKRSSRVRKRRKRKTLRAWSALPTSRAAGYRINR